ncbi:hypothetical protein TNCV_651481 [Trichonephila clavipes]|nr:hypothetical protein TNCV_651481 [Trichonephila clavipes]
MASLGHQSLPPTNLGRVDEEMVPPVGGGIDSMKNDDPAGCPRSAIDRQLAAKVRDMIGSHSHQWSDN